MIGRYLNRRALRRYIEAHVLYRDDYPSRLTDADFEDELYHETKEYKTAKTMSEHMLFNRLDGYKVTTNEEYFALCLQRRWNGMGLYTGTRTMILESCKPVFESVFDEGPYEKGIYMTWYESAPMSGEEEFPIRAFATVYLTPFLKERGILP